MTAFFGIDAQGSENLLEHGALCIDDSHKGTSVFPNTFRSIRADDIVFIKQFAPQSGLTVNAAGVAMSGYATEDDSGICIPVEWVWRGEQPIEIWGEEWNPHCSDALYEEYNIEVQRQIIDLMPGRFELPAEW